MFSIEISPGAQENIERYILAYRDAFLRLYDDTGLGESEKVIKMQYIEGADLLRKSFYESIGRTLKNHTILGYSYSQSGDTYLTTTRIGSRRLFLEYSEDKEKQIRILKNISIAKL